MKKGGVIGISHIDSVAKVHQITHKRTLSIQKSSQPFETNNEDLDNIQIQLCRIGPSGPKLLLTDVIARGIGFFEAQCNMFLAASL